MAICPFAVNKLLPENASQPKITPRIAIAHSAAGRGSLYSFFKNSSNLESHFWISEEGVIEQYIDTNTRADANLNANRFAISIETESSPSATERWTEKQAAALVRLLDWICTTHNIPRALTKTWDGSGLGWHIQFGAPGPWTPVSKSCPGPARIEQFKNEIVPAVARGVKPVEKPWVAPPFPGYTLRLGMVNQDVATLKVLLIAAGYGEGVNVKGSAAKVFGPGTGRAVQRAMVDYYKAKGTTGTPNKSVGPKTWAWICDVVKLKKALKK